MAGFGAGVAGFAAEGAVAGIVAALVEVVAVCGAAGLLAVAPETEFVGGVTHTRWLAGWPSIDLPPEGSRLIPPCGCEPGRYAVPHPRPTVTILGAPGCGGAAGGRTGTQFTGAWFTAVTGTQVFQVMPGIQHQP